MLSKDRKRSMTFAVPVDYFAELQEIAGAERKSYSEVLRDAVRCYLKNHKKKEN